MGIVRQDEIFLLGIDKLDKFVIILFTNQYSFTAKFFLLMIGSDLKCDFRKTGDYGELVCSGSITVQDVSELRHALLHSLESVGTLALRFEDVEEVDISFLQILCSAHIAAGKLHKDVNLAGTSPAFIRAVEEAGYARHFPCALGTTGACFWIVGKSGEGANSGR